MARARLFAMSSAWEGLPVSLMEALALGVPVVSTDCPSGPAEILDNGRYGRLVPMDDSDALAAAMASALVDERPSPDSACLQRFDADAITEAYLEVLLGWKKRGAEYPAATGTNETVDEAASG
jgi:glycosyltransferase involved in cell wall biosynthesis